MFVKEFKKLKLIFDICLNQLIMCKEGWCVALGQEGIAWGWVELSVIIKRGWNRK